MIKAPIRKTMGLIPAHAGKTRDRGRNCQEDTAHPRSRGENLVAAVDTMPDTGSSPLTRGKLDGPLGPWRVSRLIPAHAGKTQYVR